MKLIDKARQLIIKKLLKESDGYVYLGLVDNEPMNFYFDENIKKYVIGKRCGNFYFAELKLNGLNYYMSRHLEWNDSLKKPKIVLFREWIYGIALQINREYVEQEGEK